MDHHFDYRHAHQLTRIENHLIHISRRIETMSTVDLAKITAAVQRIVGDVEKLLADRHDDSAATALQAGLNDLAKTLSDEADKVEAERAPPPAPAPEPQPAPAAPAPAPEPVAAPEAAPSAPADAAPAPVAAS